MDKTWPHMRLGARTLYPGAIKSSRLPFLRRALKEGFNEKATICLLTEIPSWEQGRTKRVNSACVLPLNETDNVGFCVL